MRTRACKRSRCRYCDRINDHHNFRLEQRGEKSACSAKKLAIAATGPSARETKCAETDAPASSSRTSDSTSHYEHHFGNLDLLKQIEKKSTEIIEQYEKQKTLEPKLRRLLVNIVVNSMVERFGYYPSTEQKIAYAKGIIKVFPGLKDPGSSEGYEHFFDPESRDGYISWRLRTVNRTKVHEENCAKKNVPPNRNENQPPLPLVELSPGELSDKIAFLRNACSKTHRAQIEDAMRATYSFRRSHTSTILESFPKFLDTSYLITVDVNLMYPGVELQDFSTALIFDAAKLHQKCRDDSELTSEPEWGTVTRAYIAILGLLPPTAKGQKKSERCNFSRSIEKLVVFHKAGKPLEDIKPKGTQPFLVAQGANKSAISSYHIVVDGNFLPIESADASVAFDLLFKIHFVLDTKFDKDLDTFWRFIQSFYYKINNNVKFTPRMREVRSWLSPCG